MSMVEYLGSIDILSYDKFMDMVDMYGENNVTMFLDNVINSIKTNKSLGKKDKKELLSKFDYYINEYKKEKVNKKNYLLNDKKTKDQKDKSIEEDSFFALGDDLDLFSKDEEEVYESTDNYTYGVDMLNIYLDDIGR